MTCVMFEISFLFFRLDGSAGPGSTLALQYLTALVSGLSVVVVLCLGCGSVSLCNASLLCEQPGCDFEIQSHQCLSKKFCVFFSTSSIY